MREIVFEDIYDFSLVHTFECGQCFRWQQINDVTFFGVVKRNAVKMELDISRNTLKITGATDDDRFFWKNYLGLDIDYQGLINDLKCRDEYLKNSVEKCYGLRILRQEFFETVISFIISANNNITRIKGIISRLCELAGERIDDKCFAFPTREALLKVSEDDLKKIGCGYRAGYIYKAVRDMEALDFDSLKEMELSNQQKVLMQITGVGPKVADCVLLFSGLNQKAFPADVWVKRVMNQIYATNKKEMTLKQIQEFAKEHFGEHIGYAQQFLFHYFRNQEIF